MLFGRITSVPKRNYSIIIALEDGTANGYANAEASNGVRLLYYMTVSLSVAKQLRRTTMACKPYGKTLVYNIIRTNTTRLAELRGSRGYLSTYI
jgi:hypothetical protein